jgi:tryptophan synthase alpha chain
VTTRLATTFAALDRARRKALVAYLCMGDPSLEESIELAVTAAQAGADLLELGVPFSDPTADGPAIARAGQRAIAAGSTLPRVIEAAARIRARTAVPLVLFGYYNPILVCGEERIAALAGQAGIDALLVVDLPPEEGRSLRRAAHRNGLAVVPLVAPTTGPARLGAILAEVLDDPAAPAGFFYCVSMTGVTGSKVSGFLEARAQAEALRARTGWPVVVGFGIDGPASAVEAAGPPGEGASGVVVGTAIVRRIEEGKDAVARSLGVRRLVEELRGALDRAR